MKKHLSYRLFFISLVIATGACEKSPDKHSADEDATEIQENEEAPFSAAFIEEEENTTSGDTGDRGETATGSVSASRANAITNAVEKASAAVVSIMATEPVRRPDTIQDEFFRFFFGDQMPRENTSMGSGFIISEDGLVVTNQHVVGVEPNEIQVYTNEGETFEARLIGIDELTDLALLRINEDRVFPYIEFSDSDEIIVGEWTIALGNPFGLFDDGKPTVTVGVVSAINRDFQANPNNPRLYVDMIQTDAAINRGNSGGPLLNSEGKVIGVNTFIYTGGTSAGFVGLGFAIPSNRVDRIISQLLTSGAVMLDYDLGMDFTSMTESLIYRYRLPYERGLLVTSVNKDGPAYDSGIMPGDIIIKIGDERVVSEMQAKALFRDYEEGDDMPVILIRDNELYETTVKLRQKISARERGAE